VVFLSTPMYDGVDMCSFRRELSDSGGSWILIYLDSLWVSNIITKFTVGLITVPVDRLLSESQPSLPLHFYFSSACVPFALGGVGDSIAMAGRRLMQERRRREIAGSLCAILWPSRRWTSNLDVVSMLGVKSSRNIRIGVLLTLTPVSALVLWNGRRSSSDRDIRGTRFKELSSLHW
jgi:hypothetical protein